jgi:hypothetical protein
VAIGGQSFGHRSRIRRARIVTVVVFFLAEEPEIGMIVDGSFLSAGENAPKLFVKDTALACGEKG